MNEDLDSIDPAEFAALSRMALVFHRTEDYACSYLPEQSARSLVATPPQAVDAEAYGLLVRHGFRRSGFFAYRPDCESCQACVAVRVPVAHFVANRRQRRSLKRHANLVARELPLEFNDAHYGLYRRYQQARHAGGGMDQDERDQYAAFMLQSTVDSRLIEFSADGKLQMVSLVDVLADGLSAVYTFYDPDDHQASFGTYSILWQLSRCLANGWPYLYLGYWIGNCRKMSYKRDFRPIEGFVGGRWRELTEDDPPRPPPSEEIPNG